MQTVKATILNSVELQKVLERSKRKRYKKLNKSKDYCEKSKKKRALELTQEYPIKVMQRKKKVFPLLLFLVRARLFLCRIRIRKINDFDRECLDRPIIYVPTHIAKNDIEVVYSCIKKHALLLSGTEERMYGSLDVFFLDRVVSIM